MNIIEPVLYLDPQAASLGCRCRRCGGECYTPSFRCLRCERRAL